MFKKASVLLASILCVSFTAVGCHHGESENIDTTKTQLYVSNLNAGISNQWLLDLGTRFEEAYANTSFEEGKTGVQVIVDTENTINGRWLILPTDDWEVYFTENLPYNEFVSQDYLLDISDVVRGNAYGEDVTIESKLSSEMRAGLTAFDGKYYALPHYEAYRGVFYDVDVFDRERLYLAEDRNNGNNGFIIRDSDKRSAGPNGISGDYDDGLPATIEEFYKLLDYMKNTRGVTPFVWPGATVGYTEYFVDALSDQFAGADAACNFTFDSKGGTTPVITGFDGDEPIVEEAAIDNEHGYNVERMAGKYYALSALEHIVDNVGQYAYDLSNNNSTFSQLDSQERFIFSDLENQPIGMILDGNYWWNEASEAYRRSVNQYGERAETRNFAYMPLPTAVSEEDFEAGEKPVLRDVMKSYCFVNANIADDPVKVQLAKLFVAFSYSDAALQDFTVQTGVAKGLNYELTQSQYDSLSSLARSCWDVRQDATIVRTLSENRMFIENETALSYDVYSSTVAGQSYLTPFTAFRGGVSAKDYFMGTWTTPESWAESYSRYFA